MSKFLGAGSGGRVYLSDNGKRCIKVELEECYKAGVTQSKIEFMHSTLRRRDDKAFMCFSWGIITKMIYERLGLENQIRVGHLTPGWPLFNFETIIQRKENVCSRSETCGKIL